MKKILFIVVMCALLIGCSTKTTVVNDDVTVKTSTSGSNVNVDVESDDGNVKIETTGLDTNEWCPEGTVTKTTTPDGTMNLVIK